MNLKTGVSKIQSTPNFPKNKHFLPPGTHTYLYVSGVINVRFSENLACFVFLKHPFWDSPFCLITNKIWTGVVYRLSNAVLTKCLFFICKSEASTNSVCNKTLFWSLKKLFIVESFWWVCWLFKEERGSQLQMIIWCFYHTFWQK